MAGDLKLPSGLASMLPSEVSPVLREWAQNWSAASRSAPGDVKAAYGHNAAALTALAQCTPSRQVVVALLQAVSPLCRDTPKAVQGEAAGKLTVALAELAEKLERVTDNGSVAAGVWLAAKTAIRGADAATALTVPGMESWFEAALAKLSFKAGDEDAEAAFFETGEGRVFLEVVHRHARSAGEYLSGALKKQIYDTFVAPTVRMCHLRREDVQEDLEACLDTVGMPHNNNHYAAGGPEDSHAATYTEPASADDVFGYEQLAKFILTQGTQYKRELAAYTAALEDEKAERRRLEHELQELRELHAATLRRAAAAPTSA